MSKTPRLTFKQFALLQYIGEHGSQSRTEFLAKNQRTLVSLLHRGLIETGPDGFQLTQAGSVVMRPWRHLNRD